MFLNPALTAALDRIAQRAEDVRRAYTPGGVPKYDDVATPSANSDISLDPLSASAPDGAYFVTRDERGELRYGRDGAFSLRNGRLVDEEGRTVLGAGASSSALRELRIDPVDEALGRAVDARIERDGTLAYTRSIVDPRSGARELQRVTAGRVALARFPAGTRLEGEDGTLGAAPSGIAPQFGVAGDGSFAPLATMRRERSRIDVDESLIRLKEAYVAFDALQAAEAANLHFGKTAMDLLK